MRKFIMAGMVGVVLLVGALALLGRDRFSDDRNIALDSTRSRWMWSAIDVMKEEGAPLLGFESRYKEHLITVKFSQYMGTVIQWQVTQDFGDGKSDGGKINLSRRDDPREVIKKVIVVAKQHIDAMTLQASIEKKLETAGQ